MDITRRQFVGGAALSACAAGVSARPNILWLIAEDFSPDLGCYGNRLVHSPSIDGLAAEGVRFANAFVTGPVCSASRSAIATGMYQTSIGAHHHRSHRSDGCGLPDGVHVFTHYLRQAGYHTSNVVTAAPGIRGSGKTDFNFHVERPFDGTDWNQRAAGQPFYAQINFQETHRVFTRCPEHPVDPARVVVPPYYPATPAVREDWALYLDSAQNLDIKIGKVLDRLKREGLFEKTIIFFFGDHGRPMPRGKQFLYDEGIRIPLVVRIPKAFQPAGWRPGSELQGFVSAIDITATTLKLAGIAPPASMEGQVVLGPGAKFRDHIVAARDRCDETPDRIRCVRTTRYKYIRNFHPERAWTEPNNYKDTSYPPLRVLRDLASKGRLTPDQARFMAPQRPPEELYDLQDDPHELNNLAGTAAGGPVLADLRGKLTDWIRKTGDKGEFPEDPSWAEDYRYRTQVDGWASREFLQLSRSDGTLRANCSGKANSFLRSCVTEGGGLVLEFRARSGCVRPQTFFWATLDRMGHAPAPGMQAPLDFTADGQWHDYRVPFQVNGFLGVVGFDIGAAEGMVEFDWIRLERSTAGRGSTPVEEWKF